MGTLTLEPVIGPATVPWITGTARVSSVTQPASSAVFQNRQIGREQDFADEELISAICQGGEWAMELLYFRYYRYAYALAYRILHETSAAEDIVQEAFLSIWCKAASYSREYGNVHSWIQAIVHHRAIDKVRSSAHRDFQWVPLQAGNEQDPPGEQLEVWEEAWRGEQQMQVRSVLGLIPAEQRQVIELAYFEGYTHAKIAQHLRLPLGTVKGRMRLGLVKMKHLLKERGIDALN